MVGNQLPTVTVVIATFNAQKTIAKCLASIRSQDYPQGIIDTIIVDGSSKDETVAIAKKFNVHVIIIPAKLQNAEYNKGVGVREAKGELILMLDHDNVIPHKLWLRKMVQPLLVNKNIVAVETLRYHYDPTLSLLDRYFALFGIGDPLAFYLGKADRLSYMYDRYNLYGKAKDMGLYYIVEFDPDHIPTLGANGFLIRRNILIKHAHIDKDHFFHIDVNVDLIKKGFNTYAFIKDDIIHLTGYKNIFSFLHRRKLFMEQFHFKTKSHRRFSVYEPRDFWKLILFIFYAATFIKPLIDADRGHRKIADIAWFLQPFLCFTLLFIYSSVTIKNLIERYAR